MTTDIVEGLPVIAKREADFYILMTRYGRDYWTCSMTYKTLAEAQLYAAAPMDNVEAWKIVKVTLPIGVPEGEV